MPLIKIIVTVFYYLIVLFLMTPLADIMGLKGGPFQFIFTESIMLLAVIILNVVYVKQRINWLPNNIIATLKKNGVPLIFSIILLVICFKSYLYQFSMSLLGALIVAITEEYTFRGIIFKTLLSLDLKRFTILRAVTTSLITASAIFSGMHLVNLLSQSLWSVLSQVIYVFGLGILLAGIYLKNGNLLKSIGLHWAIDSLGFYSQGFNSTQEFNYGPIEASLKGIFLTILFIGITLFILSAHKWKLLNVINKEIS